MLELSAEERESVEELERRLARYALVRKSARVLRKEWGKKPLLFPLRAPMPEPVFAPGQIALNTVSSVLMRLISLLPKAEAAAKAFVAPVLALEDVIVRLEKRLVLSVRARFSELTKSADRHEIIVYFLAMLELIRGGSVSATQERIFSDITLEVGTLAVPRYGAQGKR